MTFPKQTTIQTHAIIITPRYAETDQDGVVHHSVYPVRFEMGRTELLRVNGLVYKDLEQASAFFVVTERCIKYRRPAKYDEKLQSVLRSSASSLRSRSYFGGVGTAKDELETSCSGVTAGKIEHTCKLTRCCDGVILAEGSSIPACVNAKGRTRATKLRRVVYAKYPNLSGPVCSRQLQIHSRQSISNEQ